MDRDRPRLRSYRHAVPAYEPPQHREPLPDPPQDERLANYYQHDTEAVPQPLLPQDMDRDQPRPFYKRVVHLGRPSPYYLPLRVVQRAAKPVPRAPVLGPAQSREPVLDPSQDETQPGPQPAPPQEILLCGDIADGWGSEVIPVYGPQGLALPDFEYVPMILEERGSEFAAHDPLPCDCKNCHRSCDCLLNSRLPYSRVDGEYRLLCQSDVIFECSDFCLCEETCRMRTSKRLRGDLQLFHTCAAKGWGVRSSTPIPPGMPVCEFIGVLRKIDNEVDGEGPNYYSININCLHDILERGNIARFKNHSCNPNLFTQCIVYRAKNMRLSAKQAHIVLFASRFIPAMEELTFDYNPSGPERRPCLCNAEDCRKFIEF